MVKSLSLLLVFIITLAFSFIELNADPPLRITADVNGKYSILIQKLNCPKDKGSYGDHKDYGYWSGTSYCGQKAAPGWWVYRYPHWYVWKENNNIPNRGENGSDIKSTYTELIQKVKCPKDKNRYGAFNEYGYWQGDSYCGQQVSSGWWVYRYPFWYIWQSKNIN